MTRAGRLALNLHRFALCVFGISVVLWAAARPVAAQEEEPPIIINADRMEYFSDKDLVVFTGNSLAVRGDVTLSADTMEVTLSGDAQEREESSIDKVVATGNVNFRQNLPETGKDRFATGERGVYDAAAKRITLTGKPKVWEGQNVITGNIMKFFIDEHRFEVEGDVDMKIVPEKGEEEKK